MSYQVLARKWRPRTFSELAGQEHVLQTLTHALDNQRLHHAYLFTGTRGVGKTTIARILAKCLNCEEGVSAAPCDRCDACVEINNGRFMDLIEVDAASRTKVEDTRDLLDNVQYAPGKGRYKVYLIDEVHMLSTHSFNALLKTLEEPPPHVKFLLATTDPQKLPVTILSRCLQFHLKNLSPKRIVEYLQMVLGKEGIASEEAALWQLANGASGSMRDALTLLDQAISFGEGQVSEQAVTGLLGTPDQRIITALVEALRDADGEQLLGIVAELAESNPDYRRQLEQMLSLLHRLAIAQNVPGALDNSQGDRRTVIALAEALPAEDVQLWYQIALQTLQDMQIAVDRRMVFEMGLLRMLSFTPDSSAMTTDGEPSASDVADEKKKPELKPEVPQPPDQESTGRATPEGVSLAAVDNRNWPEVVDALGLYGVAGNVLANCALKNCIASDFQLVLDPGQSALYRPGEHDRLFADALGGYFGQPVSVQVEIAASRQESPATRRQRRRSERAAEALRDFSRDPGVREIMEQFDAQVDETSLQYSEER